MQRKTQVASGLVGRFAAISALIGIGVMGGDSSLTAQVLRPSADARAGDPLASERARIVGVLLYSNITVAFEEKPAREAFNAVARALNLTFLGRYSDDAVGHGIDPDTPITLMADARPALDVLEEMLEQCETYEDCTWQIRKGMIELGTKARLATPASREVRVYDVADQLLDTPNFISALQEDKSFKPVMSPYVESVLGEATREALRKGHFVERRSPDQIMLELLEFMTETIEPGHWNIGGPVKADETSSPGRSVSHRFASLQSFPVDDPNVWATVRVLDSTVIVRAPDFIHRQIGGYPKLIKPAPSGVGDQPDKGMSRP